MPRIEIQTVSRCFRGARGEPIPALREVSFAVADRELLALAGPSASGKTTLLRVIAGLEQPDHGQVVADGQDITPYPPQARDMAMVFQSLALYPHLSAFDNIGLGLRLRRVNPHDIHRRVHDMAGRLGIGTVLTRRPADLSAGQRQRVALARALVRRPRVLLLDEPFSHLDRPLRRELGRELLALHHEFELTTVLVTHDLREAEGLTERVALLNQGRLEQIGRFAELRTAPASAFVTAFLEP